MLVSKKQEIYNELLRHSLLMARSVLSSQFVFGRKRKSVHDLCELTHNLYVTILEEDFVEHDIWFLNVQARYYYETAKSSSIYDDIVELISELFEEVPESFRSKLEWKGPSYN